MTTAKRRFIAKSQTTGRHTQWRVYDRVRGCWPAYMAEIGAVAQSLANEEEAQAEADRVEGLVDANHRTEKEKP